jgi:hypothetical protein
MLLLEISVVTGDWCLADRQAKSHRLPLAVGCEADQLCRVQEVMFRSDG